MTNLSKYASKPENSKGRVHKEVEVSSESIFEIDRHRIIHSAAFRRLEYKTQVFVNHEGDHYRTRLTHSLEVAQIARSLARKLGLNEDLAETVALTHDLGHPPFGHAGEDALNEKLAEFDGFNHNEQGLKILTKLEHKFPEFDGLNVSYEVLEGIAKHNGPVTKNIPAYTAKLNREFDLNLNSYASLEAQVAAIADDIAYNNHDIEDGLRAGLFNIEQICEIKFIDEIITSIRKEYKDISDTRLISETLRRLIKQMIEDVCITTEINLKFHKIETIADVRKAPMVMVEFSDQFKKKEKEIKTFLMANMYKHFHVNRMSSKAKRILSNLYDIYYKEPEILPTAWRKEAEQVVGKKRAYIISDFIAGMTDRFAIKEHSNLFDFSSKVEKNEFIRESSV